MSTTGRFTTAYPTAQCNSCIRFPISVLGRDRIRALPSVLIGDLMQKLHRRRRGPGGAARAHQLAASACSRSRLAAGRSAPRAGRRGPGR
jgi:hypothetical protein